MPFSVRLIEEIDRLQPDLRAVMIELLKEIERQREESITRTIFEEFAKKTEENFDRVWKAIGELAEAQKKTEERVNELAEAQKRTEQRVNELAEAQKRTEERLTRLEHAVEELAEAQKRTEEELRELIRDHKNLREEFRNLRQEVGGISHSVGYRLEDESYRALPGLLKKDRGIEIIGRLKRDFIPIGKEKYIEINIWGRARSDGREVVIVGEAKTQLKKRDIDDFIKKAEGLKKYIPEEQVRVLVTYHTSPQVLKYAGQKNIKIYFSYEF